MGPSRPARQSLEWRYIGGEVRATIELPLVAQGIMAIESTSGIACEVVTGLSGFRFCVKMELQEPFGMEVRYGQVPFSRKMASRSLSGTLDLA